MTIVSCWSNQLASLYTLARTASIPKGRIRLRRSPCTGSKTLPCHASKRANLMAGPAIWVPGAIRTVPCIFPTGISPALLLRKSVASSSGDISSNCGASTTTMCSLPSKALGGSSRPANLALSTRIGQRRREPARGSLRCLQSAGGLRADGELGLVDVLVPIAGAAGRRAGRRVEVTGSDVAVVGPSDVDDVVRSVPEGVQLDVVAVERRRPPAEQSAFGVVRDVRNALRRVERRPARAVAVRARVVDVERLVVRRHRVPEVVPGDVQGMVRHLDRRKDLVPGSRIVVHLDGGAPRRAPVGRALGVDVVVAGEAL